MAAAGKDQLAQIMGDIKVQTPKNKEGYWICRRHELSVPIGNLTCGAESQEPCMRTRLEDIYGSRTEDPKWGCVGCLIKAAGESEYPFTVLNKPYQTYCIHYLHCGTTYNPKTKEGAYSYWACGKHKGAGPVRRIKATHYAHCGVEKCQVGLIYGYTYKDWIWALPEKPKDKKDLGKLQWACRCKDTLHECDKLVCVMCALRPDHEEATYVVRCLKAENLDKQVKTDTSKPVR
ncbi:predicted protein [Plenodomus lingam JN3]|uniref:Predicted protein n=2 Tax=Leptosphaeria maculans TaxID=5022 RepID=E5ABQ2_LEPMJ|nr:predicted protein [Plenodomus lingam JN3]CBY01093.1 predicted protein [Plenodomus lingam JN3]